MHAVYVTFGPPLEEGKAEDGATRARMRAATQRVSAARSRDAVTLIRKLFDRFSEYVLQFEDLPADKRRAVEEEEGEPRNGGNSLGVGESNFHKMYIM